MCRAKKEENNAAAPLRSVSGEVFATFASLLLVALVLMCMLQTGLSCAYFAQERKSALTAVLDGATAMAETYASEGNIVTLPGGDNELVERAKTGFELFNTSSDALVFVADRDGNILMHTGKDVAESAKISSIISPYFYIRSDRDLQGDAELKITGFLIGFCIVQLKQ